MIVDVEEGRRLMEAAYQFSSWDDWDAWIEWTKANMTTLLDAVERVEAVRAELFKVKSELFAAYHALAGSESTPKVRTARQAVTKADDMLAAILGSGVPE